MKKSLATAIEKINRARVMPMAATVMAAALLGACGSEAPNPIVPVPPAFEEPESGDENYSFLKANGTLWANAEGQKVSLRGINLGNWLSMELWMFDASENPLGAGIPDQCTLESVLETRFGADEKERIIKLHRDSWITEADWDLMAEAGFNLVRIPFPYNLLEDDAAPKTLRADAWDYLDDAIAKAKARKMYVVLDLHGAAGGQGWEQHTGCAGKNELWDSAENRDRTVWLWQQIASKYKGEATVAGYGLLNEPWGTDSETLAEFSVELYQAIRAIDQDHIIILAGHNADGISGYGDPLDLGMENVAFDLHFYPGLFGWGEIGYAVHRDWITCGESGQDGVCDWARLARNVYTPTLVGEMQPWTGLGDLGGEITRASFDKYNLLNWAATAWSLKTTSKSGGVGNGQWGLVTNNGNQLLTKAQTWSCNNWESTFGNACDVPARSTVPYAGEGTKTMYLAIKTGSFNGTDVSYDSIALTNDATGDNLVVNGEFGSDTGWTKVQVWGDPHNYDYNYAAGEIAGVDTSPSLRVTAPAGHNTVIYQAVEVQGGQSYTLSGRFKDNGDGGNDMWAEIYLVPDEPQWWQDVDGRALPKVDINNDSIEAIEDFFSAFATMDYVQNDAVMTSLKSDAPATIFTNIPGKATDLVITVSDTANDVSWAASSGDVEGYRVYRSTAPRSGFEVIAEVDQARFSDQDLVPETTYYYYVAAYNSTDEGYASDIVASGPTFYTLPTKIEAENYTAAHPGVQTEGSGDIGGGQNIGHFEPGRWVEYEIKVDTAGDYQLDFRLASLVGDVRFAVELDGVVLDTVTVPNTGGWQTYETVTTSVTLPAGAGKLRLNSIDNQWNLNWLEFKGPNN
ncbi:cellulase family glycosylhydrolase [Simiduia agarivorans]|uniref:Endoglucanase-like protein n=1 Tax=Simiduia agarivorans (strain DSM 21679 / JCM 13881 / BCRC 17597 / SA1) TaxID=1117647 RepID=K4KHM6_SIMAS|nr:cellulase family glycosylhydrolase [Simiduia agarivorans]AFU98526.1 endoglucanase-like protein [Simiduia agarivorans SA1 = DSM 21679]